jgi:RNA polymerase sigma factor (sigma-70 family)
MADASTTTLQSLVERLQAGDPAARSELINRSCDRLRRLTRKMLRDFPRLRRWEEADDILNSAALRLLEALQAARPTSVVAYFRLAALQIRRELIDLARHYYGPQGLGANNVSNPTNIGQNTPAPGIDPMTSTLDPSKLAIWTEFHEQVDALPDEEKQVFDLLWYQGLTQPEAAQLLNVSEPTIKRRWLAARLRLRGNSEEAPR